MSSSVTTATFVVAAGCALVSGVFFAFSSFVMQGLGRLPDSQGIAAMQQINKTAVTPAFMTLFMGTALACIALAIWVLVRRGDGTALVVAGCALYVVGSVALTIAVNVPMNDKVDALDPAAAASADVWRDYLGSWTAWNTVRCVASLVAAGLLIGATTVG